MLLPVFIVDAFIAALQGQSCGSEDPVTGSIHAALAPLWAGRLGKTQLTALQASARAGERACRVDPRHVSVRGSAVQSLQGTIAL
ncbi:putative PhzF superfamily epimerase YddE/YHI9 [Xanthomonas arboricola]